MSTPRCLAGGGALGWRQGCSILRFPCSGPSGLIQTFSKSSEKADAAAGGGVVAVAAVVFYIFMFFMLDTICIKLYVFVSYIVFFAFLQYIYIYIYIYHT